MASEDTVEVEFYSTWPNLGKKFSQQLGEIRTDTSALKPVVRGVGLDASGDFSSLSGIAKNSVQAYEIGKQDFHNKFRTHYNKTTDVFEIAYNTGTEEVPNWYTTWWIDDDGHVTQQNTPTTASNVGAGEGWFKQKVGVDLEFKSITATSPITIVNDGNTVDVDGSALVSTYSSDRAAAPSGNADTGIEIILSDTGKTGNDLPFKALKAGPNVVIRNLLGTAIEIESTAQVVEFYGITVGHSDGSALFPEVHNLKVNVLDFYVTQEKTNPSQKTVILNARGEVFVSSAFVEVAGDDMVGPLGQADGAEALPSFTFTDDTSMGLSRKAANDLAVSIAGSYHTRFLSDRLFLAQGLQVTNTGNAGAPDIYFFPDSDTGLYQNEADDGSIAFATDGQRAGYFDSDQNLIVENFLRASNVEAGIGDFYTSVTSDILQVKSPATLRSGLAQFTWENDPDTGLIRSAANAVGIMTSGTNRFTVSTTALTSTLPHLAPNGVKTAPAYSFSSDPDTGVYRKGTNQLGLSAAGEEILYLEMDSGEKVVTAPGTYRAGDGAAVIPAYGFSDEVGTGLYRNAASQLSIIMEQNIAATFFTGGSFNAIGTIRATGGHIYSNTGNIEATLGNVTAGGNVFTTDEAYGGSWDGVLEVPTKNAVYDKMETVVAAAEAAAGFYGIVFRESEAGGAVFQTDTFTVDSSRFYLSTGGDGHPILGLDTRVIATDTHEGIANLLHLNDGGLGDDEAIGMTVASDGATITLTITNTAPGKAATDPLEVQFEGQNYTYTPSGGAETLTLTAGTATVPVENFVVFELIGGVISLVKSTTDWPSDTPGEHHARVCTVVVQDATSVQTHGILKMHAWTDHIEEVHGAGSGERGERGHIHSIAERLRNEPAVWRSGSAITIDNSGSTNPLYVHVGTGTGYQMHRHSSPALDTDGSDLIFVVNDDTTPYTTIDSLDDLTRFATGGEGAIGNAEKFTVVLWMVVNENSGDTKLFLNLPTGGYNTVNAAKTDSANKRVHGIPQAYVGTSILLEEIVLGRSGGGSTWTVEDVVDLRGVPGVAVGGGGAATTGEVNAAANVGAGAGVFAQKTNEVLEFKSLKSQDSTISVTNDADEIFMSATGNFYTNVSALRFLARDGDISNPGFAFENNPDTGLFLDSLDDLSIAQDGTTFLRIVGSRLVSSFQIYSDVSGSKTTPTFSWHGDRNTGMYQNSANDGSVAFSADGTRAGYFSATRNFFVTNDITSGRDIFGGRDLTVDRDIVGGGDASILNDLKAGRVEAGLGVFYTQLHVKSHGTSATKLAIRFDSPDDGFWNNPAGVGTTYVVSSGQSIQWWDSNGTTLAKRIDLRNGSAAATPALAFRSDVNTGLYQDTNGDDDELRITTGGVYAAHFDADQNFYVANSVYVKDVVEADKGQFYTSLHLNDSTMKFAADGMLYAWDPTRLKYLSVSRQIVTISREQNNNAAAYLLHSGMISDNSTRCGTYFRQNFTITYITGQIATIAGTGADTGDAVYLLRKATEAGGNTNLHTITIPFDTLNDLRRRYDSGHLDIDVDIPFSIHMLNQSGPQVTSDPIFQVEIAYRLD